MITKDDILLKFPSRSWGKIMLLLSLSLMRILAARSKIS